MYIGLLTAKDSPVTCTHQWHVMNTKKPFFSTTDTKEPWNESVFFSWEDIIDTGVDLHIQFSQPVMVDTILLILGETSGLRKVEVLDSQNGSCLSQLKNDTSHLSGELELEVGVEVSEVIVRFFASAFDIEVLKVSLFGSVQTTPIIYPEVAFAQFEKDSFIFPKEASVYLAPELTKDNIIFSLLQEKVESKTGIVLEKGKQENASLHLTLDTTLKEEGYSISVTPEKVILSAYQHSGMFYAVHTLCQLLDRHKIPCCEIKDAPRFSFRGIHIPLPGRKEIPFFKRLVKELLVPMRYNTIFLQITAGMRFHFKGGEKINNAWQNAWEKSISGEWPFLHHTDMMTRDVLEQEEVAELVAYARKYGIDVIPEIQSLSHAQYITLAYPEMAEIAEDTEETLAADMRSEDQQTDTFYQHSICPQNEAYYTLMYQIIDEIVAVVKPKNYVHMGHDEVYQMGICPVCKGKDVGELLALHINRMYHHLEKHGLGMMMWSDMLQPVTKYNTYHAADKIPKDIIMLDFVWYFHLEEDIEENLLHKDFSVMIGNLYSSHYPRFEKRAAKKGVIGGEVSTWTYAKEESLAVRGKIYDMLYTANMLWAPRYEKHCRNTYTRQIITFFPEIRRALSQRNFRPIGSLEPISLPKGGPSLPVLLKQSIEDSGVAKEAISGFKITKESPLCITIKKSADGIVFHHAAEHHLGVIDPANLDSLAVYTIHFEDGTREDITIEYGRQLMAWNRSFAKPLEDAYYRHSGYLGTYYADPVVLHKTEQGGTAVVYSWYWENVQRKPIEKIMLKATPAAKTDVLLIDIQLELQE